tara:strand:+ start:928 stop:1395 length:468 start_codon:yes stop_codon:yes gene_type:complete
MTKEIYQKSVDILLDSYNAGTLFHSNCSACAVGNLIAANNNIELVESTSRFGGQTATWSEGRPIWQLVFFTTLEGQEVFMNCYKGSEKTEIDSTGIPLTELMAIEKAFESVSEEENNGQYKGLCAVLDVMKDMVSEEVAHMDNVERLETIYATIK